MDIGLLDIRLLLDAKADLQVTALVVSAVPIVWLAHMESVTVGSLMLNLRAADQLLELPLVLWAG